MRHAPDAHPELEPALRDWLRPLLGEVELVRALTGGITGQMLHLRRTDGGGDVVTRRWSGDDPEQPELVRREAAGLRALAGTGLPLPALLAADPDGEEAGRPSTVTTFLPGAVDLTPTDLRGWVRRLAGMLVRFHETPPPPLGPCKLWASSDLRWLDGEVDAGIGREVRELAAHAPDPDRAVLSHGDYQHFNVLWRGGEISAVVDWPTGLADRGLDVGHCRLNLAVLFSADAAMWFLDDYEQIAGVGVDPGADLQRLLNFGPNWPEFIPLQVGGRIPVDGPGMAGRVRETIRRTLQRAG